MITIIVVFVDYRSLFHRVSTESNIFTSDEVTSENIYFCCSWGEIKSIIDKKRWFFLLFHAKKNNLNLNFDPKTWRAANIGAKYERMSRQKKNGTRFLFPVMFTLSIKINVGTGNHILIISQFQTVDYQDIIDSYISVNYR